jgi:hypothetical protein
MSYPQLIGSMLTLLRKEKVLQVRGILALLMFAAFNIFWSALVLPLSSPPYNFSHTAGLGRLVWLAWWERLPLPVQGNGPIGGMPEHQRGSAGHLTVSMVAIVADGPLARHPAHRHRVARFGGQALHVTNQSLIFRHPEAHSRLVGLYMLFYATGSGFGR